MHPAHMVRGAKQPTAQAPFAGARLSKYKPKKEVK
jgi:hypothetical protein